MPASRAGEGDRAAAALHGGLHDREAQTVAGVGRDVARPVEAARRPRAARPPGCRRRCRRPWRPPAAPSRRTVSVTAPPSGVNFTALSSRLARIVCRRACSTGTGSGPAATSSTSSTPACSAREATPSASSRATAARSALCALAGRLAGLEARQLEQVVREAGEAAGLGERPVDEPALVVARRLALGQLQVGLQRRERRADLVRRVGDEPAQRRHRGLDARRPCR